MKFINRLGEIRKNKESLGGYEMKIVKYNNAKDMVIEFQDEYKTRIHTAYKEFKNGSIKNPYHPCIYDVGYYGQGKYKSRGKDGKKTKAYKTWFEMIHRNYDPYELNKHPTYIDCYVCDEWLCFQNFAEWFYDNYYEIKGEKMCLDKDIFYKNSKIYSSETCFFVPERINILFTKRQNHRGDCVIGVQPLGKKFVAYCNIIENGNTKHKYLGTYPTEEEAFEVYKECKENHIKQIADEYYNLIPRELWKAMWEYEVEIDD